MAIKLELLAFSRKAAARYRDAGGPLSVVASTLVSGTNGPKTTLGRKSQCVRLYWLRAPL